MATESPALISGTTGTSGNGTATSELSTKVSLATSAADKLRGSTRTRSLSVPLAISFPTLPLTPGQSYVWQFRVDERSRDEWRAGFFVRSG